MCSLAGRARRCGRAKCGESISAEMSPIVSGTQGGFLFLVNRHRQLQEGARLTGPAMQQQKRDRVSLAGEQCGEMDMEDFSVMVVDVGYEVGKRINVFFSSSPEVLRVIFCSHIGLLTSPVALTSYIWSPSTPSPS